MANDVVEHDATTGGTLTRAEQAAAVLVSMGPELAARVLEHFNEGEVEQITLEIATLGDISRGVVERILEDFHSEALAHQHLLTGGERHARELLRRLRGNEGDEIVDRLLATVHKAPFHFLRLHEPAEVIQQLRDERPQTLALILAHLPTKFAAQLLAGLEPDVQADVAYRVATLGPIAPDVVTRVEAALQERLGVTQGGDRDERGGVKELAALLNHADRGTERAILAQLEDSSPELAEQVRALMFVFEDLATLEDRAIQEVLRQVDAKQLAVALKGVRTDVVGTVERNLSERARQSLHEEMELLGPVRVTEVEAAQSEIVARVRELEAEGTIVISRGDGEYVE